MDYKDGFPKQPGWYDVQVDGVDDRLVFRICHQCNRLEWRDIMGNRVEESRVRWCGEASLNP